MYVGYCTKNMKITCAKVLFTFKKKAEVLSIQTFFFSFFCTTHNILKNAIFKKRLDERKRKLKNNLYFLFKKIELKVYKKTVKNII